MHPVRRAAVEVDRITVLPMVARFGKRTRIRSSADRAVVVVAVVDSTTLLLLSRLKDLDLAMDKVQLKVKEGRFARLPVREKFAVVRHHF